MAGGFNKGKDSIEISELASLNDDITDDFIDQLHNQLAESIANEKTIATIPQVNPNDDSTLFEEPAPPVQPEQPVSEETPVLTEQTEETAISQSEETPAEKPAEQPVQKTEAADDNVKKEEKKVNNTFDDNFIKKYKAKLNKKNNPATDLIDDSSIKSAGTNNDGEPIEKLSNGNISERAASQEQKDYNASLDFLDGKVKYSKYVIYIDPQNVDFIEGLTVKERKNLINNILHQQDSIELTKHRFKLLRTLFIHFMIAIIVFAISMPLVYYLINASLEATIDNHRRSQSNWQTLYKEHGKIPKN